MPFNKFSLGSYFSLLNVSDKEKWGIRRIGERNFVTLYSSEAIINRRGTEAQRKM